uniref:Uncharacterized protein n=1 Tax=Trypanosoma congolense (strain IL3000) TaxID=1068625 RepID=G0UNY4_TRYCI|nr:hypothetical protein, unlikely [Trypanosoma congolense IL3000]
MRGVMKKRKTRRKTEIVSIFAGGDYANIFSPNRICKRKGYYGVLSFNIALLLVFVQCMDLTYLLGFCYFVIFILLLSRELVSQISASLLLLLFTLHPLMCELSPSHR